MQHGVDDRQIKSSVRSDAQETAAFVTLDRRKMCEPYLSLSLLDIISYIHILRQEHKRSVRMETAVGYLEYASSELCLAARVGYTKGDAPAAAEMARKDANQTGKGIKLEERNKISTTF